MVARSPKDDSEIRILSLCSGIAALELGIKLAVPQSRTVCFVERDTFAAAALVGRMEEQTLAQAPIYDQLETFDGRAWCGKVDLITAGFPCQPWSSAGSQKKTQDERWMWPEIANIIRDVAPGAVFLENVRGLTGAGGLETVLGDLSSLGFDAEWSVLSARYVGAPHKRERIFILAHSKIIAQREQDNPPRSNTWEITRSNLSRSGIQYSRNMGNPNSSRPKRTWLSPRSKRESMAFSSRPISLFPPPPNAIKEWAHLLREMPQAQPAFCRMVDESSVGMDGSSDIPRQARLSALGNSCVPIQVAYAFIKLNERFVR